MYFIKMSNVLLLWKLALIGLAAAQVPVSSDAIRLVNGNATAGRVEVFLNGVWGTVCDDSWDLRDAQVVCRQLGFPGAISAPRYAAFGEGSDRTHLDDVECTGVEADILSCTHTRSENCGHSKDAGVVCLQDATSSKINPNAVSTISCTTQISGNSTTILTLKLSREPDQVVNRGIQFVDRTSMSDAEEWRFTADDVKEGEKLFCLLLDRGNVIVARLGTTVMEYDLLVLTSPPTIVQASASSVTTIWTAWDPDRDDGDPPVVAYIPYYSKSVSEEWIRGTVVLPGEKLEFEAGNLESDTEYIFSITVVREGVNGEGPRSPSVAVRTTCSVSDFLPISVVAYQNTTAKQVNISWQIPEDAACSTGISFAVYYERNDSLQLLTEVAADSSWIIVDTDYLGSGTFMFFVLVTVDSNTGRSPWSNQIDILFPRDKQEQSSFVGVIFVVIAVLLIVAVAVGCLLVSHVVRSRKRIKAPPRPQSVPGTHYENAGVLYNADEYIMLDEDANKTQSTMYEVLNLDKKITAEDSLYEPVASPNKKRKEKNKKAK